MQQSDPNSVPDPVPQTPCPNQSYYHPPSQPLNPTVALDRQIPPPQTDPYPLPVGQFPTTQYQQLADGSWVPSYSHYYLSNVVASNAIEPATNSGVNRPAQGAAVGAVYPVNPPPQNVSIQKKKKAKKPKVVQSVWCEICNIECNTKDVLEVHIAGKKHKKNLLKLTGAASNVPASTPTLVSPPIVIPGPSPASTPSAAPSTSLSVMIGPQENPNTTSTPSTSLSVMIGPQENPNTTSTTSAKKKRKKGGTQEDLAAKTRKVLEGGADAAEVRTCPVCNVVCNSDTVYIFHLAGQKHAAMMKRNALTTGGTVVT